MKRIEEDLAERVAKMCEQQKLEGLEELRVIASVITATGLLPDQRERIATALFAGILASGPFSGERMLNGDLSMSRAAPLALELADKLIEGLNGK